MITANSFMKREFGKKLIEHFLPTVDITHVIDTSGAYIPGHSTPTLVLIGRHRTPVREVIRTVMSIRGEPTIPPEPSKGLVWNAIVNHIDESAHEDRWIHIDTTDRARFSIHPWNLGGKVAQQILDVLTATSVETLGSVVTEIGRTTHTGEDEAFILGGGPFAKSVAPYCVPLVTGEDVRNWLIYSTSTTIFPYEGTEAIAWTEIPRALEQHFWLLRTCLRNRQDYGQTIEERGLKWFEQAMFFRRRYLNPSSIAFAFVSTHNHFVFDRGGKVFNRSAPVIKLPEKASESEYLGLVGLLNSSTACFWMKQVFHDKGGAGAWERRFEHAAIALKEFPLTMRRPIERAREIDDISFSRAKHLPRQLAQFFPIPVTEIDAHVDTALELLGRMVALQEELDWECYQLYDISEEDLLYVDADGKLLAPPPLALGERAFEISMARRMASGEMDSTWFERHGSMAITRVPDHWPADYRTLVERRLELIESDPLIGHIERPEYKRRWNVPTWRSQEKHELRAWLLNRLGSPAYWPERRLATVRSLAERAASDRQFLQVAERYSDHAGVDIETLVADLVEAESVPALSVQRYKPSGLTKRDDWKRTWEKQRREDEIDAEVAATTPRVEGETAEDHAIRLHTVQQRRKQLEISDLAPPPKYRSADFLKPTYWRLRGALDVPKERFVSLPEMNRDSDPTLLVGWAGWSELDLCQAIATYFTEAVEQDGWTATRLTPLLAIIKENLPWLKQWHNHMDPDYNLRLGDFFEAFLHSQLLSHGLTEDQLRNWTLPKKRLTNMC